MGDFPLFCPLIFPRFNNINLQTKRTCKNSLHSILRRTLATFMARSSTKAASESDDTPAGAETLDFDDVTLRGEKKYVPSFFRRL